MRYTRAICHINLARDFRGGERQTELLVRELAERRWKQRVVIRQGSPLGRILEDVPGLEVRECSSNPLSAALATRGSLLLHAHEARAVYASGLAHLLFSTPYIFTRRVDNPMKRSPLRNGFYRRAARPVAISNAVADIMRASVGVQATIVADAHASLDHDADAAAAIRKSYEQSFLIGHVGALDNSHKGQRTAFEVARRVRETHPDWAFVFLGDGRDAEAFRKETAGLGNVYFEGFVENVGDYLAAFDLFVFPSLHEAVGSSLLDAMHFGLPVVASRVGGIPEIVEHSKNGLLCEVGNADAFLDAISELHADAAKRSAMSRANRETAAGFSAAHMCKAYEAIYQDVMQRP